MLSLIVLTVIMIIMVIVIIGYVIGISEQRTSYGTHGIEHVTRTTTSINSNKKGKP